MPRAKSTKTKEPSGGGKKDGKKAAKKEDSVDDVVDVEDGSDNEKEDETDPGETLPGVPTSTSAVRKVLLAPREIRTFGWESIQEFRMPHPRTGVMSLFLLNTRETGGDKGLTQNLTYEVLTMQQDTRSWFIDNDVISDGNLYVCTPVDPLFLVLPCLSMSDKAKPIVDHLCESSLPRQVADVFGKCLTHNQLTNVATKKVFEDIVAFVYSEETSLRWLSKKAEKVAKLLSQKGISCSESSVSSNFVQSSDDVVSKEDCLRYACDIVGEYIQDSLKRKLLEKLGLSVMAEKSGMKRKGVLENENENSSKKHKASDCDTIVPLEDYGSVSNSNTPATNKNTKTTAREKEFQKAAAGSHSLFKFFAPKSK